MFASEESWMRLFVIRIRRSQQCAARQELPVIRCRLSSEPVSTRNAGNLRRDFENGPPRAREGPGVCRDSMVGEGAETRRSPFSTSTIQMATILHVDDEPAIGLILQDTLERAGHRGLG